MGKTKPDSVFSVGERPMQKPSTEVSQAFKGLKTWVRDYNGGLGIRANP